MRSSLTILALFCALPAYAAPQCGDRAAIALELREHYAESQRFIGLDGGGNVLEMWVSPQGTFTALLTPPGGQTCIVSAGDNGSIVAAEPAGKDS